MAEPNKKVGFRPLGQFDPQKAIVPCLARQGKRGIASGVRDLKVAILQIPKKCAEICAYRYARVIPQPEGGRE
jgi:hypothetical protein